MELTKRIAMPPVRIPHSIVQLVGVDRAAARPAGSEWSSTAIGRLRICGRTDLGLSGADNAHT